MTIGPLTLSSAGWTADTVVLVSVLLGGCLYVGGWIRGGLSRFTVWRWRAFAFALGLFAMIIASCSPIDALARDSFWVHMVQHLILLMLVAPLVVVGAPWLPIWNALPSRVRKILHVSPPARVAANAWTRATGVKVAGASLLVLVIGTWIWHLPALYDLALGNDIIHDWGEHNTFLLAGIVFWLQVVPSPPFRPALGYLGRVIYLVLAVVQNVTLSVVLAFAPGVLYSPYLSVAHRPGGFSTLADQQFGAAIMWSIGDIPFVIAVISLIQIWLVSQMREDRPAEVAEVSPREVADGVRS